MKEEIAKEFKTSRPTITGIGLAIAGVIGLLYTAFYTVILVYSESVPVFGAILGMFVSTCIKFVLLLGSWWIVIRAMHASNSWLKVFVHVIFSILYAMGWYLGYLEFTKLTFGIEILEGGGFIENRIWILLSAVFEYAIVFSVIHIIYSMKKLREREKITAELKELSTQQQIANLKAQLNPHFLFNTLNSINSMVSEDVEETRNMIAELSDMLRYSLQSFEKQSVSLADEIGFIRKYLQLEKHRLGKKLEYTIDVPGQIRDVEIPPMIIQPLVENAVKHGIIPKTNGGIIKINVIKSEKDVVVEILDSGQGFPDGGFSITDGIGIRNTNNHLKKRYGKGSALNFESLDPSGSKVWFRLPIS